MQNAGRNAITKNQGPAMQMCIIQSVFADREGKNKANQIQQRKLSLCENEYKMCQKIVEWSRTKFLQMGLAVGTEKAICKNLSSMAHNLFKKDITWFKVNTDIRMIKLTKKFKRK